MARRTGRRPQVVWLPSDVNNRLGTAPSAATIGTESNHGILLLNSIPGTVGGAEVAVIPLVKDEPLNITATTSSLGDLEGSAYRLRRIVGKIFVLAQRTVTQVGAEGFNTLVTAGFIVLKTDEQGVPLATGASAYDVSNLDNIRDPWIWRRTWFVSDPNSVLDSGIGHNFLPGPSTNMEYGSVADGPHVDAKTARVIGDEERLFMVVTATSADGNNAQLLKSVGVFFDLRVLGSMRKQSGNRRNSSR